MSAMSKPAVLGEKFFDFHPGSAIGQKLVDRKQIYISHILLDPKKGFKKLIDEMGFGQKNEFWDDFLFMQIFVPLFDNILSLDIVSAINLYSEIAHLLFINYIRRDEDPVRFRRAFWNVNNYGLRLARLVGKASSQSDSNPHHDGNNIKRICFVFKGGFHLAHSEFSRVSSWH